MGVSITEISKAGADETSIKKVLEVKKQYYKNQHYYWLQYAKGLISPDRLTEIVMQKETAYEKQLIEILGEYRYKSFDEAYTKDAEKYLPPMTGLDEFEEKIITNFIKKN